MSHYDTHQEIEGWWTPVLHSLVVKKSVPAQFLDDELYVSCADDMFHTHLEIHLYSNALTALLRLPFYRESRHHIQLLLLAHSKRRRGRKWWAQSSRKSRRSRCRHTLSQVNQVSSAFRTRLVSRPSRPKDDSVCNCKLECRGLL
jgi:hypothetical protein